MKKLFTTCCLILIVTFTYSQKTAVSGKEVIKKMHDAYAGKWYSSVTFKQKSQFYKGDTLNSEQTWLEAVKMPAGLIIKFETFDSGNGYLFKNDSLFVFKDNELTGKMPRIHDLLQLGFQVYFDSPETTIAKLEKNGFDMDKGYETTLDGKAVYVVGKASDDEESNYFVIDKDRMLFLKVIHYNEQGNSEGEFQNYEKLGGGWISPLVVFRQNGKVVMKEVYYDIAIPKNLSKDLFTTGKFLEAKW